MDYKLLVAGMNALRAMVDTENGIRTTESCAIAWNSIVEADLNVITTRNDTSMDTVDDVNATSNANDAIDRSKDTNEKSVDGIHSKNTRENSVDSSGDGMCTVASTSGAVLNLWLYDSSEDNIDLDSDFDLNEDFNINDNRDIGSNRHLHLVASQNDSEIEDIDNNLYEEEDFNMDHEDLSQQHGSEDSDDNVLLGSIEKAKYVTLDLMEALKDEFGVEVAKNVIVETAKVAGIPLLAKRDTTISIDIDVDDMRRKIQGLSSATLMMTTRGDNIDIVARFVEINEQIKSLDSTSNYAQVAVFVYLLELSTLFKEVDASEDHQKLNQSLQERLRIKKAPQYSKFRRKCDRVKKLCDVLGVAGGCAMGMYVKIYSIENMVNPEFKSLIKELKINRKLVTFCHTLRIGNDGMPIVS